MTSATAKRKPHCTKGTACGYACISNKKTCSDRVLARDVTELLKAAQVTRLDKTELLKAAQVTRLDKVEDYKEVKILGKGGWGEAVLTERGTVVKRITDYGSESTTVADARQEFEMLKVLDRLDIGPRAIGFDEQRGDIEMGLVQGSTFETDYRTMSEQDKQTLADNAFKAITKLHKAGYSHNDFHPANVMFDSDLNVTVIDPGYTGVVGQPASNYQPYRSGFFDVATMFRSLGSPADRYYDITLDKLEDSGALAKYEAMRDVSKLPSSADPDTVLKLRADAERYIHAEYLKVLDNT